MVLNGQDRRILVHVEIEESVMALYSRKPNREN
jgi:hypothetical protein